MLELGRVCTSCRFPETQLTCSAVILDSLRTRIASLAKAVAVVCLCATASEASAQQCVGHLPRPQAIALQRFLAKHPNLEFLSEAACPADVVAFGRREYGSGFAPYYRCGDFNRDGRGDFALVLAEDTPPRIIAGVSENHQAEHRLAVVVFNGEKNGRFRLAFIKRTTGPLACFLGLTYEKKRRLSWGVFETCTGFTLTPVGEGYILEH
jgi:hypothetical protein